jgi:uroporphyrin-III C-methyltransferase/precorrin-2 dehydrogenase/sirohydrochlorin ferrochelatase
VRYFPLFADLHGRRVLVVGGGEVAERKVRLLREAGAHVMVVARSLTPWLAARAAEPGAAINHLGTDYADVQLEDVVLAIAATDDRALNARVAAAARKRNLLANVVDDAELSGFIVPAVVDRSPVVVAVSTAGASPVLARLIRERLESLIDESFGTLASLLARWRGRIRAAFPDLATRRRFYQSAIRGRIAAGIRAGRTAEAERELAAQLAAVVRLPSTRAGVSAETWPAVSPDAGSVVLVGAGPGDPGLLTLNGLRALQEADVILHDRLVTDEVLALARRDATRIPVGKEAGGHSVAQTRIHELMIEHARAGRRVVRLKGGDPFIFGRGGEEIEALAGHGIAFEVIPGVTAAAGAAAYAGIPLTHRDYAQSCVFVTGHLKNGSPQLDWRALVRPSHTLAIYMGVGALARICEGLIEHGMAPSMPAALVERATLAEQVVTEGTLSSLPALARAAKPPALLIVGEVVRLRERLAWFQPLRDAEDARA